MVGGALQGGRVHGWLTSPCNDFFLPVPTLRFEVHTVYGKGTNPGWVLVRLCVCSHLCNHCSDQEVDVAGAPEGSLCHSPVCASPQLDEFLFENVLSKFGIMLRFAKTGE